MADARTKSRLLLVLTLVVDVYLVLFVVAAAASVVTIALWGQPVLPTEPPGVVLFFAWHAAMFVLTICLLISYALHVARNPQLEGTEERLVWLLALFFAGPIAMPIYWNRHLRQGACSTS